MSIPFYSNIDLNDNIIENLGTPSNNTDATNKSYVDTALNNLHTTISSEILAEVTPLSTGISNLEVNLTALDNSIQGRIITEITSSIIDNVVSIDIDKALSANQGRELNERINYVENKIKENTYSTDPTEVGVYLNSPMYRVLINGTIDTEPIISDTIPLTVADDVEAGVEYAYTVTNVYGIYTTKFDVLGNSTDVFKTYRMIPVDGDLTTLTRPTIYIGNVDITNNQINTWLKFGADFQTIFTNHMETLPIDYCVVIEYMRVEVNNVEGGE